MMLTKENFIPSCQAAVEMANKAVTEPFKLDARWQVIDVEDGYCKNCPYLCEEKDPNNTGDSPTEISCTANSYRDCWRIG